MFAIDVNWIMVPQELYYILLFGSGIAVLVFALIFVYFLYKNELNQHFVVIIFLLVTFWLVYLTTTGKIVGHMMVGG